MAESNSSTTMLIVVIAAVLLFIMMNKNKSSSSGTTFTDILKGKGGTSVTVGSGFSPSLDINVVQTGPVKTGAIDVPGDLTQGIIEWPNNDKIGLPIISGSEDFQDPSKFRHRAQGLCQCDEEKCCYNSDYFTKSGRRNKTTCANIQYGLTPQACDQAFAKFDHDTTSNLAYALAAENIRKYYSSRPRAFRKAAAFAKSRALRALIL